MIKTKVGGRDREASSDGREGEQLCGLSLYGRVGQQAWPARAAERETGTGSPTILRAVMQETGQAYPE